MSCSDVEFLKVNGYYYYRFTPTQIADEGRFRCSRGEMCEIWRSQAEAAAA